MKDTGEGVLLRIFLGESDKIDGRCAYEHVLLTARRMGLAGATVLRGMMGFGADSHLHSAKVLRLSEDLPVVVEVVDTQENVEKLLAELDEHLAEALITSEPVRVIRYRPT
jgi:hypothetical protein